MVIGPPHCYAGRAHNLAPLAAIERHGAERRQLPPILLRTDEACLQNSGRRPAMWSAVPSMGRMTMKHAKLPISKRAVLRLRPQAKRSRLD